MQRGELALAIVVAFPLLLISYGCGTTHHNGSRSLEPTYSEEQLFRLREERCSLGLNAAVIPLVADSLKSIIASGTVDAQQGLTQLSLWLSTCDSWVSTPLSGSVNTDADEYGPVFVNDSLLYFTRGNGAGTLCYSEDICIADRTRQGWVTRRLGRTVNTSHNESITSVSSTDSVAFVYGQYYTQFSHNDGSIVLSANYPNDVARKTTVTYIYDPISDYQTANYFLFALPIIAEHNSTVHRNYVSRSRASTVIDNSGDIYRYRFLDGKIQGAPMRLGWPVSSVDWESDGILNPEGTLLYFVSDRPNDLFRFEEKPAYKSQQRNRWGNTNIYYTAVGDGTAQSHYLLGPPINTAYSERTPSFSADGDTMYFSSNGLPGHGGMDVFYSVRLRGGLAPLWSLPKNLGSGVNTAADELWFKPIGGGTYAFARRSNGNLDIYTTRRKPLVRFIALPGVCGGVKSTIFIQHHYDGHTTSFRLGNDTTAIELNDNVATFTVVVEGEESGRHFERCPSMSDTVVLSEEALSLKHCSSSEPTHKGTYDQSWQFSRIETESSINAAVEALCSILSSQLRTRSLLSLDISMPYSHSIGLFQCLLDIAVKYDAVVSVSHTNIGATRVTTTMQWR